MLNELVRRVAAGAPERAAVITADGVVTYDELRRRGEDLARGLAVRAIERFGVAVEAPADVVALLVGASAVGAEPCVYPRELDAEGWSRFAASFGHEVVVTDAPATLDAATALPLEELAEHDAPVPERPGAAPVLILTTGTTGEQKGARHDWRRLVASVRHPDDRPARWLQAYNLNQFAGLQVLLHVLVSGATMVVPASRQPQDVIATLRDQRVTHVSGTPTFWRLVVGALDAGTARGLALEQITLGGEAAPEGLLERLRALFPDARITHVYAGTEFGSVVSVRDGRSGLPLSVLERGDDAPVQMRIVDGELHIRSRVGMLGYHRGEEADGGWRPTGDLVEVRGDRIHFVGRTTEVINVGGAKVHPLPIEEAVCRVEGVELAAAYGRPNPVTGQIVAVDVVAAPDADRAALEAEIRAACEALPRAGRPRRIRFVDRLEVKGNKLLRRAPEEGP